MLYLELIEDADTVDHMFKLNETYTFEKIVRMLVKENIPYYENTYGKKFEGEEFIVLKTANHKISFVLISCNDSDYYKCIYYE